jgi:hypothetical protein
MAVICSVDRMGQDFGYYYYRELVDTVQYISQDVIRCIIKEQCSDSEESK